MNGRWPWFLARAIRAVPQPIRKPHEEVSAILLGPKKDFIALQSIHAEQSGIGDAQTGVGEQIDQVLNVFAGPSSRLPSVAPLNRAQLVTRRVNPFQFVIGERKLVGDSIRPEWRLQITRKPASSSAIPEQPRNGRTRAAFQALCPSPVDKAANGNRIRQRLRRRIGPT
jgi:hypothetical protein